MVGSFGLWRSSRVYVWCMELYGRHFCLWRSTQVYVWCVELDVRQFWSKEVNSEVCLMHGIKW